MEFSVALKMLPQHFMRSPEQQPIVPECRITLALLGTDPKPPSKAVILSESLHALQGQGGGKGDGACALHLCSSGSNPEDAAQQSGVRKIG